MRCCWLYLLSRRSYSTSPFLVTYGMRQATLYGNQLVHINACDTSHLHDSGRSCLVVVQLSIAEEAFDVGVSPVLMLLYSDRSIS
jgi:hypothetical protein